MAKVYNSILIGFEWAQDLTLAEGMIDPGDGLRAEFRYAPEDEAPIFSIASGGDGILIDGNEVSLEAAADKTALILAPDARTGWRAIYMDLVKVPATDEEAHLGFRLRIPAVLPVTRPSA